MTFVIPIFTSFAIEAVGSSVLAVTGKGLYRMIAAAGILILVTGESDGLSGKRSASTSGFPSRRARKGRMIG